MDEQSKSGECFYLRGKIWFLFLLFFVRRARSETVFSGQALCRSLPPLNCSLLASVEGIAIPATPGDEERWR